jgi:hypothetical protein
MKCSSLFGCLGIGFLFVLLGACALTIQSIIPRNTNNELLWQPLWKVRLRPYIVYPYEYEKGQYVHVDGKLGVRPIRMKQLRVDVYAPERCLFWTLFIPMGGWTDCEIPRTHVKGHAITLDLYNEGRIPIKLLPERARIMRKGVPIPFHSSLTAPTMITSSEKPVHMTLTIDEWVRVGGAYEIDLTDAVGLPGATIRMERFTTTDLGFGFME